MKIPLAKPEITEADIAAIVDVLRSSRLSQGPALHSFEEALAAYVNVAHAVAVNSGTSALELALRALRIEEGDEVILPSFSFMAVTNAVLAVRAVPVYAEIDPCTLNLDVDSIESLVSRRTKAIIAVHTFGYPVQIHQIAAIADRHGLLVIEDSCEALGAKINGHKAGSLGSFGIFAFYPNKQITTGEGGALVTNSPTLAQAVRSLSNQGRQPSSHWLQHEEAGFSYRLSDINCALGLQQLSRIEDILRRREELARLYRRHLSKCSYNVRCLDEPFNGRISWFAFPVLLPAGFSRQERDNVWRELKQMGIETGRYFPPAHLQPVMRKFPFRCGDLSQTVEISQRLLCMPFFNELRESEIEFACNALNEVVQNLMNSHSPQAMS